MAREEFFQNVRLAFGSVAPVVVTDHHLLDANAIERALRGADLWLTRRAVEGFEPEDFAALDDRRKKELRGAVEKFREIAGGVNPKGPATEGQSQAGWQEFRKILEIVRGVVLEEWVPEVERLTAEALGWCHKQGWPANLKPKRIEDKFLGEYVAPRLVFHTMENPFFLDPVARYAPACSGLLDLAILPSYESARVTRIKQDWYIHPVREGGKRRRWREESFQETVAELAPFA